MRRCAFLSTDNLEDFFVYDRLLNEPLKARGWEASEVSWRDEQHDWNQYDVVVVRSTWDYQQDADAFMACLQRIDASRAVLANPLSLIQWNISKQYLQSLAQQGIAIIPTLWLEDINRQDLENAYAHFDTDEIVIKPYISANADFTYRLTQAQLASQYSAIKIEYAQRSAMVQPFMHNIVSNGEYSLFYFDGHYSHAILKQPAKGDFRVQEEHGGQLSLIDASAELRELGERTIKALRTDCLYARVDIVDTGSEMAIIEVELIEPSLYFNMDPSSPERFAEIFANKYR